MQNGKNGHPIHLSSDTDVYDILNCYPPYRRPLEVRNAVVEYHLPLAEHTARYEGLRLPPFIDFQDVLSAAYFGLIHATDGYDPTIGVLFRTYARMKIRGSIIDELRAEDEVARPIRENIKVAKNLDSVLTQELQRTPTIEEIIDRGREVYDLTPSDCEIIRLYPTGLHILSEPRGKKAVSSPLPASMGETQRRMCFAELQSGEKNPFDSISDERPGPDYKSNKDELLKIVAGKINEQEWRIVFLKYWEDLSMREIGEVMQLSESRVCKVHQRMIERLREKTTLMEGLEGFVQMPDAA